MGRSSLAFCAPTVAVKVNDSNSAQVVDSVETPRPPCEGGERFQPIELQLGHRARQALEMVNPSCSSLVDSTYALTGNVYSILYDI